MKIEQKLVTIQTALNVPKNNFNSYGGYKYRSCEDILESVKPLLKDVNAALTVNDEIVLIGERYYIKATATLRDCESTESISNTAYAREAASKKGMDESQITGSASSYARKYALNGLFCIDDVKDADTRDNREEQQKTIENSKIDDLKVRALLDRSNADGVDTDKICKLYKVKCLEDLTEKMFSNINLNWSKVIERCGR